MEWQQNILLATAIIVPIILLRLKRRDLLLCWVCFTFPVQVFDTVPVTNLPATRIVGLILLPSAILQTRSWLKLKPMKAWMINFIYLLILGFLFGYLWPWPDITMSRPFTLAAQGRWLVYSMRLLTDLSLIVFVINQALKPGSMWLAGRAFVAGSTVSSLTALFEIATKIDLYEIITGLEEQLLTIARARGLAGEPRGLGLVCAYGIMILLIGRQKLFRGWMIMLVVNLSGLLLTYSASSLVLLGVGIVTAWVFLSNRLRWMVSGLIVVTALLVFTSVMFLPQQFEQGADTVQSRLDPERKLYDIPPGTFGQEIAYRLDVFDSSALLFLIDNPLYAVIGAGPGLVSLPASYYVPPGIYSVIWNPTVGINGLPFHGLLLELSNGGIFGLFLWCVQVYACWIALRRLSRSRSNLKPDEADEWEFAYALFLIGAVFYLVQVHSSPIWSVILGIGCAAVKLTSESKASESFAPADARSRYGWQPPGVIYHRER